MLEKIEFRHKAEHFLEGKQYSMEMQMIHRSASDPTDVAIVTLLFDSSNDKDNDFMLELNPRSTNIEEERTKLSIQSKLIEKLYGNFLYYSGSLTTPGCEEGVKWFVFTAP